MDEFAQWAAKRANAGEGNNVVALAGREPFIIDRAGGNLQQFLDLTMR